MMRHLKKFCIMITDHGWAGAYPLVFGARSGTEIAKAVDIARGGYFEKVPEKYPEDTWYTYL